MTGLLRSPLRWQPLLWFGLLAAAVVATEYYAVHRPDFQLRPALPPAVAFDLLVVLPGLAYWLLVRRGQLPRSLVAAVFGGGLALSHWLLPAGGLPLLAWAGRLAQVLEALGLSYTAVRLRRIWRSYRAARQHSVDFIDNLHVAAQALPGLFGTVLLTEVAVFRYGLLSFGAAPEVGPSQTPFSTYRNSGFVALLATLAGLSAVEMTAVHLVVARWHPYLAWGLTAASGYSVLWLLAHGQAVRRRPVLVAGQTLVLRVGFCWHTTLKFEQIAAVQLIADAPAARPGLLNTAKLLLTPPNVLLTLAAPQVVRGPFGLRRVVSRLAFYVDEPAALLRQLGPGPA
ncbi:MAG: hypothetical protein EOO59_02770 [Hymenobacter sp.]|nr:MAG: hypothetical protein EOO59_02770 [Hymenobacter sp.]